MRGNVILTDAFATLAGHWQPRIIAELNGQHVKVVVVQGEFPWHTHDDEDELFWVVSGRLLLRFRDRDVWLEPGEMLMVPRGVEHAPFAEVETQIVLFEPAGTVNTGDATSNKTFESDWL